MIIYIDNNFKCHTTNDGEYREFDVQYFDEKCSTFIEGYRYVPTGEVWIDEHGTEYHGEMISPWKDYSILAEAQRNYEDGQADILTFVEEQLGVLQ